MSKDIERLICLAENGDAEAQFQLGECYFHGQGIGQDYAEAVKWYREPRPEHSARLASGLPPKRE